MIGRRRLIASIASAVAWPFAARAQQRERMRRVGVIMGLGAEDPEREARLAAFVQGLQQFGWTVGHNVRVESRSGAADADSVRKLAAELLALSPDVILAGGSLIVGPLLQMTRTVPIVFTIVPDPVGAGYVESMARPGGNATGFTPFDYAIAAKWLELLKEIAPRTRRVGVIRDPTISAGIGFFGSIQSAAPTFGVEITPINVRDAGEIERGITQLAGLGSGGLIITGSALATVHRNLIIALAARHELPAVFFERTHAAAGGLMSYGPDFIDQYRRAAAYVDRILRGEKPADLPVQAPTKYELVINLKTAKALGIEVPPALLVRADEVIE